MSLLGNTDITHEEIEDLIKSGINASTIATNTALTARGWSDGAVTNSDTYHFDTSNIIGFRFVTAGNITIEDADGNSQLITGEINDQFAYAPYKVMATDSTATIQLLTSSGSVTRTADA